MTIKPARTSLKAPARVKRAAYARLWRSVEGAVVDTFKSHPEYFTEAAARSMVPSITKRVVGAIVSMADRTREGGRLGGCNGCPLVRGGARASAGPAGGLCDSLPDPRITEANQEDAMD